MVRGIEARLAGVAELFEILCKLVCRPMVCDFAFLQEAYVIKHVINHGGRLVDSAENG